MIEQEYAMTMGRLKEVQEQKEADQDKPEGKKEVKLVKANEVDKLIDLLENEAKVI